MKKFLPETTHMLMRLANAEEYNYLTGNDFYDYDGNPIVFIDFIPDGLNLPHFPGAKYHNDQRYFGVFLFKNHPHAFRWETDYEWKVKPVIVYFTGEEDDVGCFKRFETQEQAISWLETLYPFLGVEPDWKSFTV